jgi:serine protease Do
MRLPREYGPSLVVLAAAGAVLLAGPAVVRELGYQHEQSRVQFASERLAGTGILEDLNQAFRDLAVAVEPSVVHIAAAQVRPGRDGATSISTGSGWIYDDQGHIVTNHHVVSNSRRIEVQLSDGSLRPAELVGSDPLTDIAVIRVDPDRTIPAVRRPVADPVEQGDLVFAFGSPFDFRFSMSQGVVSGKDRYAGVLAGGAQPGYENFIQVDAAINPGNSGGPLTDFRGRVIGMNTAIATTGQRSTDGEGRFAGIGLAIPVEMIEPVVGQIIERGYALQGFLGVALRPLTPLDRVRLGFDAVGIIVRDVTIGSAADAAGLEPDDVITELNGDPVEGTPQFIARVGSSPPGTEVRLNVRRMITPGTLEPMEFTVVLGQRDSLAQDGRLPPNQSRTEIPALGIGAMETSTRARCRELGIDFIPGVIVTRWVPGTHLARGTPDNAIIYDTNGMPVRDVESFLGALGTVRLDTGGSPTKLRLADGRRALVYLQDLRPR